MLHMSLSSTNHLTLYLKHVRPQTNFLPLLNVLLSGTYLCIWTSIQIIDSSSISLTAPYISLLLLPTSSPPLLSVVLSHKQHLSSRVQSRYFKWHSRTIMNKLGPPSYLHVFPILLSKSTAVCLCNGLLFLPGACSPLTMVHIMKKILTSENKHYNVTQ